MRKKRLANIFIAIGSTLLLILSILFGYYFLYKNNNGYTLVKMIDFKDGMVSGVRYNAPDRSEPSFIEINNESSLIIDKLNTTLTLDNSDDCKRIDILISKLSYDVEVSIDVNPVSIDGYPLTFADDKFSLQFKEKLDDICVSFDGYIPFESGYSYFYIDMIKLYY